MNRKFGIICWYVFLFWSVVELILCIGKFKSATFPALPAWIDFLFFTLAALNIFLLSVAHVGSKKAIIAFLLVCLLSGGSAYFGASRVELTYTPLMGPLLGNSLPLALPLLWWTLIGACYLLYRYLLPVFDARVISLLTSVSVLVCDLLLEPFAWRIKHYWIWNQGSVPWQNYFAWLILAFVLARIIPLKGDSAPADYKKPLIVILILIGIFLSGNFF